MSCSNPLSTLFWNNAIGRIGALILLLQLPVWAGGVVTTCTEQALRLAMAGGGSVTFACDGTITLASTLTNDVNLTLDGIGRQVTISGGNVVRVFVVKTNVTLTLTRLALANGNSLGGSAVLNLGGTVNLAGVNLSSNNATNMAVGNDALTPKAGGGAIFNRGGWVNATNCLFAGNSAQTSYVLSNSGVAEALVYGGAVRNEGGHACFQSCVFVDNRASGGGVAGWSPGPPGPGDPARGGAIHNSGTMTLDLCSFTANSAAGGWGGAYGGGPPSYGYDGGAGAEGSGGAICNQGTLVADRTSLSGNAASGGEGGPGSTGFFWLPSPHLNGFTGGSGGAANGAAICNLGSLWVARSTFASNVVTGGVGGRGGEGETDMEIGGSGGSGANAGSGLGGALYNTGSARLVNCTIVFNTGRGGNGGGGGNGQNGLYGGNGGHGGDGGSGFGGVDGTCDLTNCTLACNTGIGGSGGKAGAAGKGLSYPGTPGTPGTNGMAWGGTMCSALPNTLIALNTPAEDGSFPDPKLGPLADNGGPTLTMALLSGSPAIDAGNTALAPASDQRGCPRPAGLAVDIGAFEYGSVMPILSISPSGASGLTVLARGNADQPCRLLLCTPWSDWTAVATNRFGSDGTVTFYDTCAPAATCRFYRLVMP